MAALLDGCNQAIKLKPQWWHDECNGDVTPTRGRGLLRGHFTQNPRQGMTSVMAMLRQSANHRSRMVGQEVNSVWLGFAFCF